MKLLKHVVLFLIGLRWKQLRIIQCPNHFCYLHLKKCLANIWFNWVLLQLMAVILWLNFVVLWLNPVMVHSLLITLVKCVEV